MELNRAATGQGDQRLLDLMNLGSSWTPLNDSRGPL